MHTIFKDYEELLNNTNFDEVKVVILCGLPGSGKSTLGELIAGRYNFLYLSSDKSRVEVLKLTVGKFGTNSEYINYKATVYAYMREKLAEAIGGSKKIVLDATHINEERELTIDECKQLGLRENEVIIVVVDAGERENVRLRIAAKQGKNEDGRGYEEAWADAYDYFVRKINSGEWTVPHDNEKGYKVVWVKNY